MSQPKRKQIEAIYALSPMQQGMLFHTLLEPESGAYFEQLTLHIQGILDQSAFSQALAALIQRHGVLRTSFVWKKSEKMLQAVQQEVETPIRWLDWRAQSQENQQQNLTMLSMDDRRQGFNLNTAPLLRVTMIQFGESDWRILWSNHHLLYDGWSVPILLGEMFAFYEAFRIGQNLSLPPVRPYRDYIAWLQNQDVDQARRFWTEKLKGFSAPTALVLKGMSVSAEAGDDYPKSILDLGPELSAKLQELARKEQLTVNTMVQTAWALTLSRHSGEADVVFGATVSGRPPELSGVENMPGLFINTLPVRVQIKPAQTILSLLHQVQKFSVESRDFEYTPLADVRGWSEVHGQTPLFESLVVFENYPVDQSLQAGKSSLKFTGMESFERTNYPLTVVAAARETIILEIAFESKLFNPHLIAGLLRQMANLLRQIAENPGGRVDRLQLLDREETQQVTAGFNNSARPYPAGKCLHQLFEDWAECQPDAEALRFYGETLSYGSLNRQANQVAGLLNEKGVRPEDIIAVYLDRSPDLIIIILGILKAGAAYVPIDVHYPAERVRYILEDSRAGWIFTESGLAEASGIAPEKCLSIADSRNFDTSNPLNRTVPQNLAYLIYTSGSTGKPKGTLLHHDGAVNTVQNIGQAFHMSPGVRVLQFASIGFDASVAEIFGALGNGATLCLIRYEDILSAGGLLTRLREDKIGSVTLSPSVLAMLDPQELPDLICVGSVGEACSTEIIRRWSDNRHFINGYGPTEATVCTSTKEIPWLVEAPFTISIGQPAGNTTVYILDSAGNPAPVGVPGELCVGGVGLARGYLNRPELTAEKFIPNSFGRTPGERLYRTGDLVRWLPGGEIEFIGRIDFQVKIRGFRIELGEIEAVLASYPGLRNAAVLARNDLHPAPQLVAYYTFQDKEPQAGDLQNYLKSALPDFMIPAYFMPLENFPLTSSGKIDRKALPRPEQDETTVDSAASLSSTEEILLNAWKNLLQREQIGPGDSFFDLGGHSLLATQLLSRIRDVFNVELPLRSLFEQPTIEAMARNIDRLRRTEQSSAIPELTAGERPAALPLSFAQQRLWFLDRLAPGSSAYNTALALQIHGTLSTDRITSAANRVIARHESLRTLFREEKGEAVQVILPALNLEPEIIDLSAKPGDEQETQTRSLADAFAARPFDLQNGPLIRLLLIRLADEEHLLVLCLHHIITDGWSMNVLVRDLIEAYDRESDLPALPVQYADFALWQRNWLQGAELEQQIHFWQEAIGENPPPLELPADFKRPPVQTFAGQTIHSQLPPELAAKINDLARQQGSTLFMILLAAFQSLLHRYSGQSRILIGSPIANRTRSQTEDLIGFFVNNLIYKADFEPGLDFRQLLRQVREHTLQAYAHQDLPFEQLVDALHPDRDMSHSPLFQVAFILQNAPRPAATLPGLSVTPFEAENQTAKYDLTLYAMEKVDGIGLSFEYNTALFRQSTIRRMEQHFHNLLENLVSNPKLKISQTAFMDSTELDLMLRQWNATTEVRPGTQTVTSVFESVAATQAQLTAVQFAADSLTYDQLNRQANRLARYLVQNGLKPGTIVGLSLYRSPDVALSILAILKAGGAFLPIDPTYPEQRIRYMIEDSGISLLLTTGNAPGIEASGQLNIIDLAGIQTDLNTFSDENLNLPLTENSLAYVIYTSGSTGQPKGTLLEHSGLCNLAAAQRKAFSITNKSRILQFAPLSFDASVWETVMALLNGAALIYTTQESLTTGPGLFNVLHDQRISTVTPPPSVLTIMPEENLPDLKTIITAGEKCTLDLVRRWGSGRQFVNAYGPTETTVCASMFETAADDENEPPIGRPIDNFRLYVLDRQGWPVPVGVSGELCIGGAGLARGYLNRPELSAEKFIPDAFSGLPGERLYCSGDLVRWTEQGQLEFLGRIDHQVKLRGFRIELGEVEARMAAQPEVVDAAALVFGLKSEEQRLAAYYVTDSGQEISAAEWRRRLKENLPEYMIPSVFIRLEEMPLTPSGKVDRRRLPKPDLQKAGWSSEFVTPQTPTEIKLATIAAELLGLPRFGLTDNFFESGGHSLLVTKFIFRIKESFGIDLPLRLIFEQPTIAGLAAAIDSGQLQTAGGDEIERLERGQSGTDELPAGLEGLTEEQIRALLAGDNET